MIPRRNRMPSADIRAILQSPFGRSLYFRAAARSNGRATARFAIVVGTKTARGAVRRHLLKRRVAGAIRKMDLGGRDIVITILPAAAALSPREFRKNLEDILKLIRI